MKKEKFHKDRMKSGVTRWGEIRKTKTEKECMERTRMRKRRQEQYGNIEQ